MVDLQPLRKCRRWKDGCTKPGIHMKYLWRQWTLTQKCTMHVMIHLYITRMSGDMGALSRIVKEHLCLRIYLKGIVAPTHHQMSLGTFLHCLFVCCMTCPELHWRWCSNLERLFWLSERDKQCWWVVAHGFWLRKELLTELTTHLNWDWRRHQRRVRWVGSWTKRRRKRSAVKFLWSTSCHISDIPRSLRILSGLKDLRFENLKKVVD